MMVSFGSGLEKRMVAKALRNGAIGQSWSSVAGFNFGGRSQLRIIVLDGASSGEKYCRQDWPANNDRKGITGGLDSNAVIENTQQYVRPFDQPEAIWLWLTSSYVAVKEAQL
jgi:hypothetical protein